MSIPAFTIDGVLPPHTGNPTDPGGISPYVSGVMEFCKQFGTTPERRVILLGWLRLRDVLRQAGFTGAFQWVDGSFLEDVERNEGRAPRDVDVVTFFWPSSPAFAATVAAGFPTLIDHDATKSQFLVDHYFEDLSFHPARTVGRAAYWNSLFSHRRDDLRKGMLQIELGPAADDDAARQFLQSLPPAP